MMSAGRSASTYTAAHRSDAGLTSSCHHRSRDAVHGTSRPSRRSTTTFVTSGHCASASSAVSLSFTTCPRRWNPSAVIRTLASLSCSRDATAWAPNPEQPGVEPAWPRDAARIVEHPRVRLRPPDPEIAHDGVPVPFGLLDGTLMQRFERRNLKLPEQACEATRLDHVRRWAPHDLVGIH